MKTSTWATIIVIGAIIWTLYYVYIYTRDHNWAWGIMILFACCMFTPLGVYFLRKFFDGF